MLQDELVEAIAALDENRCISLTEALVREGCGAEDLFPVISKGVVQVGDKFSAGEFFIGDLIVSGMLIRTIISLIPPKAPPSVNNSLGRIIIGVAAGDIHDIGKDIVVSMLRIQGFEVIDLGVDVKAGRFIYAVENYKPDILLISGLLNCTIKCMHDVIQELTARGLRAGLSILVGGGAVGEHTAKHVGSDAAASDPMDTIQFCLKAAAKERDKRA